MRTILLFSLASLAFGQSSADKPLTGAAAFSDATKARPGVFRKITPGDLPTPGTGVSNQAKMVPRPANAMPQVPSGFKVEEYTTGLKTPRAIRTAPNGDSFLAETDAGQVRVYRGIGADGKPQRSSVFASGFVQPFGLAFYPQGANPQWLYVSNTTSVIRYPYKNGDLVASGAPETIITGLPAGGHSTRDLAFSLDGKRLFVGVGSSSNVDDPDEMTGERLRANILEYTPEGKLVKVYGAGIRNPAGIAVNPTTGELWCSVNERDMLGDNLVPDYITHVQEDGFYGWPYYYMGGNQDPRLAGKHPELKSKVIVPDVLLQPHNASLQLAFYTGKQFPAEYQGDIFAAEHGSWNRSVRAGYELIRIPLKNGKSNGVWEQFMTGFVLPNGDVWGRPVGVGVAADGTLLVSDDGSGSIWRVSHVAK